MQVPSLDICHLMSTVGYETVFTRQADLTVWSAVHTVYNCTVGLVYTRHADLAVYTHRTLCTTLRCVQLYTTIQGKHALNS